MDTQFIMKLRPKRGIDLDRNKVDVIVIGGGSAGMAAAITLARANKKVVVIERGNFAGSKNMFGGSIYVQPTAEIYPEFWKSAPIERFNVEHKYALLGEADSTTISYKNPKLSEGKYNSCTVFRAKWDRWCAQQAENEGVYIAPETVVTDLIKENGKFVGVRTYQEDFFADIIIIAEGVNSILTEKAGLKKKIQPKNVAVGVKEVIKLDKEKLQDRLLLDDNSGCIYTIVGGPLKDVIGLGYIYTNKESIVIGLGVELADLQKKLLKPYELLEELKAHPQIQSLIKDGEVLEYSAHLIPEGGYNAIPKLYTDGLMVVGDAAMLVNNIHWEGTNLAMISGKLAAETAIEAINSNDFSEKKLSLYKKKLDKSFIMKDLKAYKDVMNFVAKNSKVFVGYYPNKVNEFFEMFTSVDSIPKRKKIRDYIFSFFKERKLFGLISDVIKAVKVALGVIL